MLVLMASEATTLQVLRPAPRIVVHTLIGLRRWTPHRRPRSATLPHLEPHPAKNCDSTLASKRIGST